MPHTTANIVESAGARTAPQALVLAGFAGALFTGALLLFWMEPLFAKMVLPLLGGAPAVWTTAMMFFQGVLLASYAYAHLAGRLTVRWQVMLHLALLAVAAGFLPLGIGEGWTPPTDGAIVPWLLAMMTATLGLPFFVLAATAPLLQHWFARSGHRAAGDPYFLYAASNLGSLAALLGYPLLLEPALGVAQQSQAWTAGFAMLAVLIAACAVAALRAPGADAAAAATEPAAPAPQARTRLAWIAYGFVPSSLMLGVTGFLSTDLAAGPMLWVIPLALYLLSFVLVFARRTVLPHRWMVAAQPLLLLLTAATIAVTPRSGGLFLACVVLHLGTFFVTAMACHGALARRRPHPAHLTQFYLLMAVGGLLGGVFNALAAPLLFDTLLEYPLVLVLACLLRPRESKARANAADLLVPAAIFAIAALPALAARLFELAANPMREFALVVAAAAVAARFAKGPLRLALALAAILITGALPQPGIDVLTRERSFFGTHEVRRNEAAEVMELRNGSTLHGVQSLQAALRREPTAYYTRPGPVGQFLAAWPAAAPRRIGMIGLGAGVIACYGRPGDTWTFFEIDPVVDRLARDTRYFSFLADCAPQATTVLGDARLSLAGVPDGSLDLLVLDAFSSDSVPTHLLTREAVALYLRKLAPDGLMLFNISNRHLRLAPVVARLGQSLGLAGRVNGHAPQGGGAVTATPSLWAVLGRDAAALSFLDGSAGWVDLVPDAARPAWTDDHADLIGAMRLFD